MMVVVVFPSIPDEKAQNMMTNSEKFYSRYTASNQFRVANTIRGWLTG